MNRMEWITTLALFVTLYLLDARQEVKYPETMATKVSHHFREQDAVDPAEMTIEHSLVGPLWTPEEGMEKQAVAYINRFKKLAVQEYRKFHIPPSISLAQGILESTAGTSKLCKASNNHFGIKAMSKKWKKKSVNFPDDRPNDRFRKYETAWASWRDHSLLLATAKCYKRCFRAGLDYRKWAEQLKKAGYATQWDYDKRLIRTIEQYNLHQIDEQVK